MQLGGKLCLGVTNGPNIVKEEPIICLIAHIGTNNLRFFFGELKP